MPKYTSILQINKDFPDQAAFELAYKTEADVIVTATVLGFIGTRWWLGQPCSFEIEHPTLGEDEEKFLKDTEGFLNVMSAMSTVLGKIDPSMEKFLKDSQSPEGKPGELITGHAGGQSLPSQQRHRAMNSALARLIAQNAKDAPSRNLYQGRGAYTGMIDDPVNHQWLVQATKRVINGDHTRWHPSGRNDWGLIQGNTGPAPDGMGQLPQSKRQDEIIGYIHGMSSAIVACVRHGPWCTPFEMATGTKTTKMASCFPCCTYMYAAGYPPSSMHLGRGESWVPPAAVFRTGETTPMPDTYKIAPIIINSLADRWHREVYGYLYLGTDYLKKTPNYVADSHKQFITHLSIKLGKEIKPNMGKLGGNLFLDALTVHDSDWKRIARTLEPLVGNLEREARTAESAELIQYVEKIKTSISSLKEHIGKKDQIWKRRLNSQPGLSYMFHKWPGTETEVLLVFQRNSDIRKLKPDVLKNLTQQDLDDLNKIGTLRSSSTYSTTDDESKKVTITIIKENNECLQITTTPTISSKSFARGLNLIGDLDS